MLKVLAIDDERIVRVALSTLIDWEPNGFRLVATAGDGRQGLEEARRHGPDIVITDLMMPKMNGIELIEALSGEAFAGKIVVLSNYGDYELVREAMKRGAIDYLLKATLKPEELLTVLGKAAELLAEDRQKRLAEDRVQAELHEKQLLQRNQLWLELLSETESALPGLLKEASQAGIPAADARGRLLYLAIDRYDRALADGKIRNKKLLHFSMANILRESLSGRQLAELVELGAGRFAVLLGPDGTASLRHLAAELIQRFQLYLNLTVNAVASEPYAGIRELRERFGLCREACSLAFYTGPGQALEAREWRERGEAARLRATGPVWANRVRKAAEEGDLDALAQTLDEMMESVAEARLEPEAAKRQALALLSELERASAQWDSPPPAGAAAEAPAPRPHELEPLRAADRFEAFRAAAKAALLAEAEKLRQRKFPSCRKEVRQVLAILRRRLSEKVTLEELAGEVCLDVSYLCRIFKQDMGKSIFQYFHDAKIAQAVELLKRPDARVKEVSAAVGIDDPFYFNRLFKKTVGASPSEYRKRFLLSGEG